MPEIIFKTKKMQECKKMPIWQYFSALSQLPSKNDWFYFNFKHVLNCLLLPSVEFKFEYSNIKRILKTKVLSTKYLIAELL